MYILKKYFITKSQKSKNGKKILKIIFYKPTPPPPPPLTKSNQKILSTSVEFILCGSVTRTDGRQQTQSTKIDL